MTIKDLAAQTGYSVGTVSRVLNRQPNVSEKAKNLKYVLTRNHICDVEKLEYFSSVTLDDGTKTNLFAILENINEYTKQKQYRKWLGYLRDFFKTNKVPVYLETSLSKIGEGSVTLKDKNGECFTLDADSVILSVGYTPAPVAKKKKHVHIIGDAASVGNLRSVIWGAWDVCMKL